jgi:branched-chain amino acid transport system substrate-binding protein
VHCLSTVQAQASDAFEIDVVLPLTGGASFLGKAEQEAFTLYEKLVSESGGIHGKPLKFVFHDDQSNPQTAVQLTNKIKATSPPVIIGSTLAGICNAMAPLVKKGPVMYCLSPALRPQTGGFVFSSSVSTVGLSEALLRYFGERGWKKIGLITSTDASGQDAYKIITSLAGKGDYADMSIVEDAQFNPTDVSASAQVQRIKGADPDAVIVWTTGGPVGTVLKAIRDAGLDKPIGTTDGNMTFAQMTQYAPFMPKELYIPAPQWLEANTRGQSEQAVTAKHAFFRSFKDANLVPDGSATFAWDPALVVTEALRQLPEGASAEQLRDHINSMQGIGGINGVYDFKKDPQRGLDKSNVVVTIWDPGIKNWKAVSDLGGIPLK